MKNRISESQLPVLLMNKINGGGLINMVNTIIMLGYQVGAVALRVLPPANSKEKVGEVIFLLPSSGNQYETLIGYEARWFKAIITRFKILGHLSISTHDRRQLGTIQTLELSRTLKLTTVTRTYVSDKEEEFIQVEYRYP